jgi:hypothetical protein
MSKFTKFWLITIFILAFAVRFVDLGTHFGHYDDVMIASDILKTQAPYFREQLITALYDQSRASYNDKQKIIGRYIYEKQRSLFNAGIFLAKFLIVPAYSNVAPVQCLITPLLIQPEQSYKTILFYSRLPSFLFSVLTLLPLYLILRQKTNSAGLWFGLLLYALSLESIIYAKQSYSYAIGCFSATLLLLLFQHSQKTDFFQKHWLFSGCLTSLLVYTHYQLVFFLPAYYLVNLYQKRLVWPEIKKLLFSGFLNFLLCLPVLYYLFFVNSSGHSYYTIGKAGEFLFSPVGKNIFLYPIVFLLKNSFLVITNTLTPVTANNIFFWLFGALFFGSFICGLKKTSKQPEGLFILLSLLTYLGLVFGQKLALTPMRQALVYLPFFIYVIVQSIPELKKGFFLIIAGSYLSIFLIFFPGFVTERQDKINQPQLVQIIGQYNPDLIIGYNFSPNTALFKEIRHRYNYLDSDNLFQNKPLSVYKNLIFLSVRAQELNSDFFNQHQEIWNTRQTKYPPWQNDYAEYKVVYQQISTSNTELEPNNWNTLGGNNLFFYVLQL